jgi:prephenate dehydrogenase
MKRKIGIVGLGLIGGSIEKALKLASEEDEILTVSHSQGSPYKLEDLRDCDLVFLCGSQTTILSQLEEITKIISRSGAEGTVATENRAFANTIITDVASTKKLISQKAEELGLINFVPGHPMAGTEHRGYEASFPELFEGAKWILGEKSDRTKFLEDLITKIFKSEIIIMDPVAHDQSVALISHLPLVLSIGLGEIVSRIPSSKKIIGPGFKGMVRLAKGNVELGKEMITINRANIKNAWDLFKTEIDTLLEIKGESLEHELLEVKKNLELMSIG